MPLFAAPRPHSLRFIIKKGWCPSERAIRELLVCRSSEASMILCQTCKRLAFVVPARPLNELVKLFYAG